MPLPPPNESPTLADLVNDAITAALYRLRGSQPGRVESYDPQTQTASIQPLVSEGEYDESGERFARTLPVVNDCPVLQQGGKNYWTSVPVEVGTTGLLVSCSCATAQWMVGLPGQIVDPKDDRRHHLSDSIFIPGFRQTTAPLTGDAVRQDAIVINAVLGSIIQNALHIYLGSASASDPVVRQSDLQAVVDKLNSFISAFNGHGHFTQVPAPINANIPSTQPTLNTLNTPAAPALIPLVEGSAADATGSPKVMTD